LKRRLAQGLSIYKKRELLASSEKEGEKKKKFIHKRYGEYKGVDPARRGTSRKPEDKQEGGEKNRGGGKDGTYRKYTSLIHNGNTW